MPKHVIGEFSQRALVQKLKVLVDDASAKGASAHRDQARQELRHLLETENWRTTHVMNNIFVRRCKYIASIGFWVPSKWLAWNKPRPGEEPKEVEYE